MTPGCSMARSPRPLVPAPCSSTGGRDRMAAFADTMALGTPCIASRAMGVIRRGHPTDDAEDGAKDLQIGSADEIGPVLKKAKMLVAVLRARRQRPFSSPRA